MKSKLRDEIYLDFFDEICKRSTNRNDKDRYAWADAWQFNCFFDPKTFVKWKKFREDLQFEIEQMYSNFTNDNKDSLSKN